MDKSYIFKKVESSCCVTDPGDGWDHIIVDWHKGGGMPVNRYYEKKAVLEVLKRDCELVESFNNIYSGDRA